MYRLYITKKGFQLVEAPICRTDSMHGLLSIRTILYGKRANFFTYILQSKSQRA